MSNLYLDSGYLNVPYLDSRGLPFNILTGGRGIGKTYGVLRHYVTHQKTIIYMRRTDQQAKIASNQLFTPYKSIFDDLGMEYTIRSIGPSLKALYPGDKDFIAENDPPPLVYFVALSTFANIRGFDASDCEAIVYDEFIPEKRERPIKDEGEAVLNAYETINRNRELKGRFPAKMWMLSNANDIASPIFAELGLLETVLKMSKKQTEEFIDKQRGLQLILCYRSPISQKKADTALYKLVKTDYTEMALNNSFRFDDVLIQSLSLKEYNPIVSLGEITFYQHKSQYRFYATFHRSGNPPIYGTSDKEITRFYQRYSYLYAAASMGYITCESMEIFYLVDNLLHR